MSKNEENDNNKVTLSNADLDVPAIHMEILDNLGTLGMLDGDAVLYEILRSTQDIRTVFESSFSNSKSGYGVQFLRIIYGFEKYVNEFLTRGCTLSIVFFKEAQAVWARNSSLLALRQILINHLKCNVKKNVIVIENPELFSEEWKKSCEWHSGWFLGLGNCQDDDETNVFQIVKQFHHFILKRGVLVTSDLLFKGKEVHAFFLGGTREGWSAPTLTPIKEPSNLEVVKFGSENDKFYTAVKIVCDKSPKLVDFCKALAFAFESCRILPIKSRAVSVSIAPVEDISKTASLISDALLSLGKFTEQDCSLIDSIDCRFAHVVLSAALNALDLSLLIPTEVLKKLKWDKKWKYGKKLVPNKTKTSTDDQEIKLFPFPESFVNQVLGDEVNKVDVYDCLDKNVLEPLKENDRAFQVYDFLEGKPLVLGTRKKVINTETMTKWQKKRVMRADDLAAFWNQRTAQSLTDCQDIREIPIMRQEKKQGKKKKNKKTGKKALELQEKGRLEKLEKEKIKDLERWNRFVYPDIKKQKVDYDYVRHHLKSMVKSQYASYLCDVVKFMLSHASEKKNPDGRDKNVLILRLIFDIYELGGKGDVEAKEAAIKFFKEVGFEDLSLRAQGRESDGKDIDFLLREMGPYLKRNPGKQDDRILHFEPDLWQVDLLNIVDKNESALLVAPTSSGKTFISFYVMEKVLRADDNGILIYVCPTKALVDQVYADIQARYRKTYNKISGNCVAGVFTRDRRYKEDRCQILVTVPQCMEILMLAPSQESQDWMSRIKYIIFDEVHNLNDPQHGEVWERLLQLTSCPFVALSATLGDTHSFRTWLSHRQNKEKVHEIVWPYRYNDLRYFVAQDDAELNPVSPLVCMSVAEIIHRGFPDSLQLEPRDTLSLVDKMKAQAKINQELKFPDELEPSIFFNKEVYLTRSNYNDYENKIKTLFTQWCCDPNSRKSAEIIMTEIFHTLKSETVLNTEDQSVVMNLTLKMAMKLKGNRELPGVFFNFDREFVENMVTIMVNDLRAQQKAWENSPEQTSKRERFDKEREKVLAQLASLDKILKRTRNLTLQQKEDRGRLKDKLADLEITENVFSMRYPGEGAQCDHMLYIKRVMKKTQWPNEHPLIDGLLRGVGCHHAGLPTAYRKAVEILLRYKYVTVVFATETLSQGVHMPCRTVLFLNDSAFLNAVTFRQMAGRAGRRGFDTLGRVAFVNVPFHKMRRLFNTELPRMRGSFPLSVSIVFRLVQLEYNVTKQSQKELTRKMFAQFCDSNLLGGADVLVEYSKQLKQYFRFSMEFLMKFGLLASGIENKKIQAPQKQIVQVIEEKEEEKEEEEVNEEVAENWDDEEAGGNWDDDDAGGNWDDEEFEVDTTNDNNEIKEEEVLTVDSSVPESKSEDKKRQQQISQLPTPGAPLGLAGLVMHLGSLEAIPGNFLLVQFFKDNVFFDIIKSDKDDDDKIVELLEVLACVVFPQRVPQEDKSNYALKLPPAVVRSVKNYNDQVVSVFQDYLTVVGKSLEGNKEVMPISKFSSKENEKTQQVSDVLNLSKNKIEFHGKSAFCAITGEGDKWKSTASMIQTVRSGVYVDYSVIPTYDLGNACVNNFAVQFFKIGEISQIISSNRVKNPYAEIKSFMLVLQVFATSIHELEKLTKVDDKCEIELNIYKLLQDKQGQYRRGTHKEKFVTIGDYLVELAKRFTMIFQGTNYDQKKTKRKAKRPWLKKR